MVLIIVSFCGIFIVGLLLILWSEIHAIKKHRQGLQLNRFQKRIEQIGHLFLYIALFFPANYELARLPNREHLWLSILILFVGLLLTTFAIIDISLKIVKKILVFITRLPLTRVSNTIANIITFCIIEGGVFLAVAGFGFLVFILMER